MELDEREKVRVGIVYGLCPPLVAELPRGEIEGLPATEVIRKVARQPQRTGPARRTAAIVAEVISSGQQIDVEISDGGLDDNTPGTPIRPDASVLPRRREAGTPGRETDDVTISLSEPYVGGCVREKGGRR